MNMGIFSNTQKQKDLHLSVKYILVFCTYFLFYSCQEKKEAPKLIPTDIIPKDSMVLILKDIYTLEGAYFQNTVKTYVTEEAQQQYAWIFKKHHISADQFNKSLFYYQQHTPTMSELYDQILEQLSIEEAKTNSITPTP